MAERAGTTVTGQLRAAILAAGVRRRRISLDTGIHESVLSRFVRGERGLDGGSIDTLCAYLGLELSPTRGGAGRRKTRKGR